MTTEKLLKALLEKTPIKVADHYIMHRKQINHPYPGNGNVYVDPSSLKLGSNSIIYISVGGNDVVLNRNMNIKKIIDNLKKIIEIYKKSGARVVYILPYPPTDKMIEYIPKIHDLYEYLLTVIKTSDIDFISLEDFGNEERKDPGSGIPEPTKKGSKELAKRIEANYKDKVKSKLKISDTKSFTNPEIERIKKCAYSLDKIYPSLQGWSDSKKLAALLCFNDRYGSQGSLKFIKNKELKEVLKIIKFNNNKIKNILSKRTDKQRIQCQRPI